LRIFARHSEPEYFTAIIGFMKEIWIVVSDKSKIKQKCITCYGIKFQINDYLFLLKAGIAE